MSLSGDFGMPHPFNKIVPDAHIFLDANILDDKPGMAILVTKIFATWAQIEHELSVLLIRVLGANAAPAIAMHTALTAQHLQNTALQAAAKWRYRRTTSIYFKQHFQPPKALRLRGTTW